MATPDDNSFGRPQPAALVLAEYILKLRRGIAPPGSRRERVARKLYIPLINRMRVRTRLEGQSAAPVPEVVRWQGIPARGWVLSDRPRILILKLDHIGDFIVALSALEHLRAAWPEAHLSLVCGAWNRGWAEQIGWFKEVVTFDFFTPTNAEWRGASSDKIQAFDELGLGSFDLAIDLRHDPDTRVLLSRVAAKFKAGFCAPALLGGDCLDISLPDMEHVSVVTGTGRPVSAGLRLQLLAFAVIAAFAPSCEAASRLAGAAAGAVTGGRYAVLAPGAGSPIRIWPISRLADVGRAIADRHGLELVVTGSAAERTAGEEIAGAMPNVRVTNLAGALPLSKLPAVIAGASLYVGLDTGTTHLAAAQGVPTVAIVSGVPELEVWAPMGENLEVVAGRIACSPCYLTHAEQCGLGVPCLMAITVTDVVDACDLVLKRACRPMAVSY